MKILNCGQCDKEFLQKTHRSFGVRFCSINCYRNFVKRPLRQCVGCEANFDRRTTSKYCSHKCYVKNVLIKKGNSGQFKKGQESWFAGKKRPDISGSNHPLWKGTSSENKLLRHSLEMKQWRKDVFERDDYRCMSCGDRGVKLHADHILPFAYFPRLRFDINNGRTLCVDCHKQTETYLKHSKSFSLESRPVIHLTQ